MVPMLKHSMLKTDQNQAKQLTLDFDEDSRTVKKNSCFQFQFLVSDLKKNQI